MLMHSVMTIFRPKTTFKVLRLFLETIGLCLCAVSVLALGSRVTFAQSLFPKIQNSRKLLAPYSLNMFRSPQPFELTHLKIAILDGEFSALPLKDGVEDPANLKLGSFFEGQLPENLEFRDFSKGSGLGPTVNHGTVMAQILWEVFNKSEYGPQLFLLKVSSHYSSMEQAIDFAIQQNVKVIVNSNNLLFGSNFNGKGVYERLLKKAHAAGILWINSAGNEQKTVFSQPVLANGANNEKLFIELPDSNDTLKFQILPTNDSSGKPLKNPVKVVLSWNDFHEDPKTRPTTDLDMKIYDHNENIYLPHFNKAQVTAISPGQDGVPRQASGLAREEFTAELLPGIYSIHALNISKNFDENSLLQIVVSSQLKGSVKIIQPEFVDRVLYPADSELVISAGTLKSSFGTTSDGRKKPDVIMPRTEIEMSYEFLDPKESFAGSSNAAALLGGLVGRLLVENPKLTFDNIKTLLSECTPTSVEKDQVPAGIPKWTTPTPLRVQNF
jgi:hypothetical protein